MRNTIIRFAPLALVLLADCVDQPDQAAPTGLKEKVTSDGARILRPESGHLTAPSSDDAATIAADFLLAHTGVASPDELTVDARSTSPNGVTHVRLIQVVDGLRVYGAYARVAISERGEVIQAIERLARVTDTIADPSIDERAALDVAMTNLGYHDRPAPRHARGKVTEFDMTDELHRAPTVERVAYIGPDGELLAGFLVETWSGVDNQLDHTLVAGDGAIVTVEHRTNTDSYKVFVEDPGKAGQVVVNGPGAGNTQSPAGWLGAGAQTATTISGNNVSAYLDVDANNAPDAGTTPVADGNFVTTVDLNQAPTTAGNRAVAVQNLFYFNNIVHDRLYTHGFNEANGNFQVNNFGKGGAGNDPVKAEAQDGSGTDNANMSTPTDGSSPRMQMYLWTGSGPDTFVTVNSKDYGAYYASFGPAPTVAGKLGPLAVYNDGTGVASDGCEASVGSLTGKIAIVDRGTCNFTNKVYNAQLAGAVGVIIANNDGTAPFKPGGTNAKVKISSAMVSQADGAALKALAGASANLRKNPTTPLQKDGDLDADIVFHEYGHGLTWRMIGGMSGALAGAIGEGASDVVAFLINGDDVVGEYSYGNALGIRRYRYAGYPLTYGQANSGEVHNDGEIYAAAMWRVLENYQAAGLSADQLMHDFVDGMNYTPATPAFEDMRDGMLQSVAGTNRVCLIWKGFAALGIGVGADGKVAKSGSVTITESFAVPATCP